MGTSSAGIEPLGQMRDRPGPGHCQSRGRFIHRFLRARGRQNACAQASLPPYCRPGIPDEESIMNRLLLRLAAGGVVLLLGSAAVLAQTTTPPAATDPKQEPPVAGG